jgi:hypothetical protein
VDSKVGEGSTFRVFLSVEQEERAEESGTQEEFRHSAAWSGQW